VWCLKAKDARTAEELLCVLLPCFFGPSHSFAVAVKLASWLLLEYQTRFVGSRAVSIRSAQ
jgi:hypothetical protein